MNTKTNTETNVTELLQGLAYVAPHPINTPKVYSLDEVIKQICVGFDILLTDKFTDAHIKSEKCKVIEAATENWKNHDYTINTDEIQELFRSNIRFNMQLSASNSDRKISDTANYIMEKYTEIEEIVYKQMFSSFITNIIYAEKITEWILRARKLSGFIPTENNVLAVTHIILRMINFEDSVEENIDELQHKIFSNKQLLSNEIWEVYNNIIGFIGNVSNILEIDTELRDNIVVKVTNLYISDCSDGYSWSNISKKCADLTQEMIEAEYITDSKWSTVYNTIQCEFNKDFKSSYIFKYVYQCIIYRYMITLLDQIPDNYCISKTVIEGIISEYIRVIDSHKEVHVNKENLELKNTEISARFKDGRYTEHDKHDNIPGNVKTYSKGMIDRFINSFKAAIDPNKQCVGPIGEQYLTIKHREFLESISDKFSHEHINNVGYAIIAIVELCDLFRYNDIKIMEILNRVYKDLKENDDCRLKSIISLQDYSGYSEGFLYALADNYVKSSFKNNIHTFLNDDKIINAVIEKIVEFLATINESLVSPLFVRDLVRAIEATLVAVMVKEDSKRDDVFVAEGVAGRVLLKVTSILVMIGRIMPSIPTKEKEESYSSNNENANTETLQEVQIQELHVKYFDTDGRMKLLKDLGVVLDQYIETHSKNQTTVYDFIIDENIQQALAITGLTSTLESLITYVAITTCDSRESLMKWKLVFLYDKINALSKENVRGVLNAIPEYIYM